MEIKEPTLVVGTDIRVVVREDVPKGTVYLVDASTITQTDPGTGEVLYPFRAAKIFENLAE